jgi:NNP family nitrate/nitrite transporter-like MFS transporter
MEPEAAPARGHLPTLLASFLHFDLSFMLWVMFGALGNFIAEDAGLSNVEKGLVVAVPLLTGSLLRIPLGILSDRMGAKRVGVAMLAFLFLPLAFGWQAGSHLSALIAVGLMLGVAGASFAVALPLASRWYPAERQGLVMGIAAAGNSGTVIANLAAPRIAGVVGWHNTLALAMVPLAIVFLAFLFMAKDRPSDFAQDRPFDFAQDRPGPTVKSTLGQYATLLKQKDLWWFCVFYSVTFGGYVGLSSFLPIFFRDEYGVSKVTAGYLVAGAAFLGSAIRPLGGYLADRIGGVRMLTVLLLFIGLLYMLSAQLPPLPGMTMLLLLAMACLGLGNGATFQAVPQRFPQQIGGATGVIGALGGAGGFLLPMLLETAKESTDSFSGGFLALGVLALVAALLLRVLTVRQSGWQTAWRTAPEPQATKGLRA